LTVGAGIEGAIGGNWTAKLEYLYIDLGNISGSFITPVVAQRQLRVRELQLAHHRQCRSGRHQLPLG
jgi:hypothetical protein